MNNIEQQVVNIKLSKELKMLGFNKSSYFLYILDRATKTYHLWSSDVYAMGGLFPNKEWAKGYETEIYAYTSSELGEILPKSVNDVQLCITKTDVGMWYVGYEDRFRKGKMEIAKTQADAMAMMLINLIESKLLTI